MCCGGCAKCLGVSLLPLAILCTLANILLFFPGGEIIDSGHITDEVWYFGGILGSGVLMVFPALVFLGLKNNDCCGCCGNEGCGKRFAMFTSIIFAAVGVVGAGYSFVISAVALNKGPKCQFTNGTANEWGYPFENGCNIKHQCLTNIAEAFDHPQSSTFPKTFLNTQSNSKPNENLHPFTISLCKQSLL
ncbi:hypothetical protein JRQ81_017811 [Phrynocephalus forsythii]|uniref:Transmembrane 4 L6 family member 4 n=1 Tax=Phrynocephalus forsythii TaxID=171643 RepID=A0A9Q1B0J2_9SAUR|nr:hypothetical protein JRQ81_017811 [Phrynocephalus forsythii]